MWKTMYDWETNLRVLGKLRDGVWRETSQLSLPQFKRRGPPQAGGWGIREVVCIAWPVKDAE